MAILKATVRFRNKRGLYPVYIRFTQVKQVAYVKTSWVVNDKGLNPNKRDITDPFVNQQTSLLIESYYKRLNQIDTSNWTVSEIVNYVTELNSELSFSDYACRPNQPVLAPGLRHQFLLTCLGQTTQTSLRCYLPDPALS